jgi:futalosine hydrolase
MTNDFRGPLLGALMETTGLNSERPRWLFVVAAPKEAEAVCRAWGDGVQPPKADWQVVRLPSGDELVQSGVGKVNGALCVAKFADPTRHSAVINVGICGALACKGRVSLNIGDAVLAERSVYADEGVATPRGFQSMSQCGFSPGGWPTPAFAGDGIAADAAVTSALADGISRAGIPLMRGTIATVSLCSGTNVLAECTAIRAGAIAEAMEGAAIGHAVRRLFGAAMGFAELRVVSNTTGDRDRQQWDIAGACQRLSKVVRAITNRAM